MSCSEQSMVGAPCMHVGEMMQGKAELVDKLS